MNNESMKSLKKLFAIKWVIYIMLAASIFFYFFLAVLLKKMNISFIEDFSTLKLLRNIFAFIAAVELLIAFYIRRNLKDPVKFLQALKKREFDPMLIQKFVAHIEDARIRKLGGVVLYSNTLDIISWVLCESVAVFGLILFILSTDVIYVQAFGGAALLSLAFFKPDFAGFLMLIDAAKKDIKENQAVT